MGSFRLSFRAVFFLGVFYSFIANCWFVNLLLSEVSGCNPGRRRNRLHRFLNHKFAEPFFSVCEGISVIYLLIWFVKTHRETLGPTQSICGVPSLAGGHIFLPFSCWSDFLSLALSYTSNIQPENPLVSSWFF
jgi:hypothetical protein